MKDLITEARELCEKATPGPWIRSKFGLNILTHDSEISTATQKYTGDSAYVADQMAILDANAAFIARSRTLIPELCDALEKAEAEIEEMKPFYKIADDTFRHWENAAYAMRDDERKRHRWVPVTEQLPTERGYYLAVIKRIAPDELGGNNTRVKIMRWMGEDWRYPLHIPKWINEAITETVTHWMPLPELPKGE